LACATGSRRKAGAFRYIHVDPAYMESILPPPLAWLKPFLPFVPPFDIDTNDLCSFGPPEFTFADAASLFALLKGGPPDPRRIAIAFIIQVASVLLWQSQCECNPPEPTPPIGTAPGAPVDVPVINPPSVVTGPGGDVACLVHYPVSYTSPAIGVPTGGDYAQINYGAADVRRLRALTNHVVAGATHPQMTADIAWYAPGPILISRSPLWNITPGSHAAVDVPVLPGSNSGHLEIFTNSTSSDLVGGALEAYCGPAGGSPCCSGTDPRLLALVTQVNNLVTIVQRYAVPFSSVPGTVHAGLSGDGSFAVNDLLGLRVQITSHSGTHPDLEGTPPYIWDQGWVSIMTGDGLIDERRVSFAEMSWQPRLMEAAVLVGYHFFPGTTATITELRPEP
jgi:hypothetical protein